MDDEEGDRSVVSDKRIEAPVTVRAYFICAFAAFGGIFFGYDSGYINGVLGMDQFVHVFEGLDKTPEGVANGTFAVKTWQKSLIVSILSAGTFFGALFGGDIADFLGRRLAIIIACVVFLIGDILQVASSSVALLAVGRIVSGFGIGGVSSVIVLYMSEIAPRKVRGAIVAGYQFFITIGLMTASCVDFGTQNYTNSGAYRIPIGLQMLWAVILAVGLFLLPDSPRYFVKKGKLEQAAKALSRVRGQPTESDYIKQELAEIIANHEYELLMIPHNGYLGDWFSCFRGSVFNPNSNLRRTILGTSLQMMQQWTGVNFIFYFGTTFFQQLGTIQNAFLLSMITTIVNVLSTPLSFYIIERIGRRPILLWGALGMVVCQFLVAIIGVTDTSAPALSAMIAFICIYIFFFASTWGPAAWVIVGEIFPLPIRARGVGLSAASNWLWNCIIAVITPYMVDPDKGNLKAKVFFIWGSLCACAFVYTYFIVPETKGLTLEQVDKMMEETTPRTSAKWKPHSTFAAEMNMERKGVEENVEENVEEK